MEANIGWMGEPSYDVKSSIACQERYCKENGYPMFAPSDGICYRCGRNIYSPHLIRGTNDKYSGIPTFRAGCTLITGCPHCHYSYCD